MRTGSVAGTVTGRWSLPPVKTRTSLNAGMSLLTGSVSSNRPSS